MENIEVKNLCKIYNKGSSNQVKALDDVSFSLEQGSFTVILGTSGAGKSTLLNILGGMDVSTSGEYLIDNEDVSKFNEKKLVNFRRKKVGFVFQFYNLMPNLTALENVQLAASVSDNPFSSKAVMELVGLKNRSNNFPSQLSGGEQQRVSIARALVKRPELLLCDEPTGALDSKTGASILSLLYDVSVKYKQTVIIVTHNSKIADCAKHLIRISDGKLISHEVRDIITKPEDIVW